MNRRSVLRGLGSVVAWGSCGLALSAGSCEFEYEREARQRREAAQLSRSFEMWAQRERERQLEEAKKLAEERNEAIRKVLDEFWQYQHQLGHQDIRGVDRCIGCSIDRLKL